MLQLIYCVLSGTTEFALSALQQPILETACVPNLIHNAELLIRATACVLVATMGIYYRAATATLRQTLPRQDHNCPRISVYIARPMLQESASSASLDFSYRTDRAWRISNRVNLTARDKIE
jgi:hypothetical protein